jgi:Na+/H+-dicarboxylate symporter
VTTASQPEQATRFRRLPRFGLTAQIVTGLALGILVGLFSANRR